MASKYGYENSEYPRYLLENWASASIYQRELMIEISRAHARGWTGRKRRLVQELTATVSSLRVRPMKSKWTELEGSSPAKLICGADQEDHCGEN